MMCYTQTLVMLFMLFFADTLKMYCQNQQETEKKLDSTRQAISFGVGDFLEVGYRRSLSGNLSWGGVLLVQQNYLDESGDIYFGGNDRNIENRYTLGLKLQMIYSANIYNPVNLNIGGGVLFKTDRFYWSGKNQKTQEYDFVRKDIDTHYGFSFMTGLEIKIYKQFRITGQFNIFAGYWNHINDVREASRKDYFMIEVENILLGGVIYF